MAKSRYERHALPFVIDFACAAPHLRELREQVVPQASGRVLEIGIGIGMPTTKGGPPALPGRQ